MGAETKKAREKLFIVDTMALVYRSYYALTRMQLRTRSGIPTWAVYGTAVFLHKIINEEKPDYLVCVTESEEPTFRHEVYEDYKANRETTPNDLSQQFPLIFELFEHLKIPVLANPKHEADDVIGTLAKKFSSPHLDAYIVSNDKDFMQLVSPHVLMFIAKKGEVTEIVDEAKVRERFQCSPEHVIDVLALMGDAVDNVPGVPGIGEKTAAKLVSTYGTLEDIYKSIDKLPAKQQQILTEHRKEAQLSKQLVTIDQDVPIKVDLETLRYDAQAALREPELRSFYEKVEFQSLLRRLPKSSAEAAKTIEVQDFEWTDLEAASLRTLLPTLAKAEQLFAKIVTGTDDPIDTRPTQVQLAVGDDKFYRMEYTEECKPTLQELFTNRESTKIFFNLKPQLEALINVGIDLQEPFQDLMLEDYLIDSNQYDGRFDRCVARHLGATEMGINSANELRLYGDLRSALAKKIRHLKLDRTLEQIELPLVPVLAKMEQTGVHVDTSIMENLSSELSESLQAIETEIYEAAGEEFNINSPKQLQHILFEKLNLYEVLGVSKVKKTQTGLSTDESVLEKLSAHKVPRLILEYRGLAKLKSTYVDTLPQCVHGKTGRIHARFNQTGAGTGRLSSDKPNLQNIPKHSRRAESVRKAFCPQKSNWKLIGADYSQIEMRLVAFLSESQTLIHAFQKGLDIHAVTAGKIFNVKPNDVSSLLRSRAKAVNFGIIYGMGPQKLAADTGVTLPEAKDFISKYFDSFPEVKTFLKSLLQKAKTDGYSRTLLGRIRPINGLHDDNRVVAKHAENIAVNAPLQGLAADIIKLAMVRADAELTHQNLQSRLILQVHDELVFECPPEEVTRVEDLARDVMENVLPNQIELKVNVATGNNWQEV
ncbi:MAG: DNA polymerase I [Oligoflexales bacterium]